MTPQITLQAFDCWLSERDLSFEAVIVGGSALALLGLIDRPTRDVDVIAPGLPEAIAGAARAFATEMSRAGQPLAADWLNTGPIAVADALPAGWEERLRLIFAGSALRLHTLGRQELLLTKLFALCDRGTDLADCLAMAPSAEALRDAEGWLLQQDASEIWPSLVGETLNHLRTRLGHGV
jgi:hypothetical protein